MYFVKMLKWSKLTCMQVADDIAKIIIYVPVETGQTNRWTDMLLVLGDTEVRWTLTSRYYFIKLQKSFISKQNITDSGHLGDN